ncbi:MAG TPA: UDP-N-acetylmuramoyl-tripeptide--D-alanyl-D-alanine ligase, partial [Verrucomicrobiae bacterium]|nr:UDP-N-acetylmuramoyl-tripeptide--D-alanyl-D-alanine ligase [Verrucomicrobiae bacterium]
MFSIEEVAAATGGMLTGGAGQVVQRVSTDSRTAAAGDLFVALRGERFDAHDFIDAAAGRGVAAFLVEAGREMLVPAAAAAVGVSDTLRGLGDLAAFHRRRFDIPVAAITGSNGKTSTKEMLASILSVSGEGLKTEGNLNNLIGLPHMVLRLHGDHRWAVLEMGMSEPGEIDRMAEIAAPRVGVITNVFPAHLESMGSVENVARAKGELFLRLQPGAVAVYNADDPLVAALPAPPGVDRLSFGIDAGDVRAEALERLGRLGQRIALSLPTGRVELTLHAFGRHNVANAAAAAAAAVVLGVPAGEIAAGLERFRPYDKRFRLEDLGSLVLIDDSYNANPASTRAALETLAILKEEGRGIAVLGDMLELGPGSAAAHRETGRIAASTADRLYLLGEMGGEVAAGA